MYFTKSNVDEIPFIPRYDAEVRNSNPVRIWWFERNFSQAQYGENSKHGTNSCTLIAILVAESIATNEIETSAPSEELPRDIILAFGLGILKGNYVYGNFSSAGRLIDVNLSIPEAMKAAGEHIRNLQEWIYAKTASQKITTVLKDGLNMWKMVNFNKKYFFVVIIADSRSVLLCFQDNNKCVTFFDSHFHSPQYGAVIAQTEKKNLFGLINWIIEMFVKMYHSKPNIFELSFIPIKSHDN